MTKCIEINALKPFVYIIEQHTVTLALIDEDMGRFGLVPMDPVHIRSLCFFKFNRSRANTEFQKKRYSAMYGNKKAACIY